MMADTTNPTTDGGEDEPAELASERLEIVKLLGSLESKDTVHVRARGEDYPLRFGGDFGAAPSILEGHGVLDEVDSYIAADAPEATGEDERATIYAFAVTDMGGSYAVHLFACGDVADEGTDFSHYLGRVDYMALVQRAPDEETEDEDASEGEPDEPEDEGDEEIPFSAGDEVVKANLGRYIVENVRSDGTVALTQEGDSPTQYSADASELVRAEDAHGVLSWEDLGDEWADVKDRASGTWTPANVRKLLRDTRYLGPIAEGQGGVRKVSGIGKPGTGLRRPDGALYDMPESWRNSVLRKALETDLIHEVTRDELDDVEDEPEDEDAPTVGYIATERGAELLDEMDVCPVCGERREPVVRKNATLVRTGADSGYCATSSKLTAICRACEMDRSGEDAGAITLSSSTGSTTYVPLADALEEIPEPVPVEDGE